MTEGIHLSRQLPGRGKQATRHRNSYELLYVPSENKYTGSECR